MLHSRATKSIIPVFLLIVSALLAGAAPRNIAVEPVSRMSQVWWRARFEQKQLELHQKTVELLWLGDSITQDWER